MYSIHLTIAAAINPDLLLGLTLMDKWTYIPYWMTPQGKYPVHVLLIYTLFSNLAFFLKINFCTFLPN